MIRRWDKSKPPTGPFALNCDCPQAQGLVAWYPMGGASARNYASDQANKYHVAGTSNAVTLSPDGAPAQTFVAANSQALGIVAVPATEFPLSIAGWCRPATLHSGTIAGLASNTGASGMGRKLLYAHNGGTIRGYSQDNTAGEFKGTTSTSYAAGQWIHAATVFAASNDNRTFLNAAGKGTSSTIRAWGTADRLRIGDDNTGGNYFNGDIGEVGFWSVTLDDGLVWRLYDPSTRFELWYPLRSRKWIVGAAAGAPTITALSARSITATSAQPRTSYS